MAWGIFPDADRLRLKRVRGRRGLDTVGTATPQEIQAMREALEPQLMLVEILRDCVRRIDPGARSAKEFDAELGERLDEAFRDWDKGPEHR